MEKLQAQIEQLASAAVQADPLDLPSLAGLHTRFEQLAAQVDQLALAGHAAASQGVLGACDRAKKLVEALVLRETTDLQGAIGSVRNIVADIQMTVESAIDGSDAGPLCEPTAAEAAVVVSTDTHAVAAHTLEEALVGADVFLGLSAAGALKPDMVKDMAAEPIIFAMANPDPEITVEEVA